MGTIPYPVVYAAIGGALIGWTLMIWSLVSMIREKKRQRLEREAKQAIAESTTV